MMMMMMMVTENEFQEGNNLNINDIDLSLLRLSSPPYDNSGSSPVSDESNQPKRRRISLQDPVFITSPLRSTYPETHSSSIDDPAHAGPVQEKHETSPSSSKSLETERKKMVNNHVEEITHEETNYDTYEEMNREETNYDAYETQQEEEEKEEDCGEGMRIERSGDGFVIRLNCRCKLAYRVLFSDHHLYFKSL